MRPTVGALTGSGSTAAISVNVPTSTTFLELPLLHGWFVFDPTAPQNPLGPVTTAGLAAVIGT